MSNFGYNEYFITSKDRVYPVPMPNFSEKLKRAVLEDPDLRDFIYLDYTNYTVVMNKTTRQLIFAASNIDQEAFKKINRSRSKEWDIDNRIDRTQQLDNRYYRNNDWDRGHMVRRTNNCWGNTENEALKANNDTFYYTNSAFQHMYFNQDEWLKLEDFIRTFGEDSNGQLCVFTGPVHKEYDRMYSRDWHNTVRIPSGFFKIVCYHGKNSDKLEVRAFILYQDKGFIENRRSGSLSIKLKNYQVTITEIEKLTGLDFADHIAKSNPLYYYPENSEKDPAKGLPINNYPERIPVETEKDIVSDIDKKREVQEAKAADKNIVIVAAMVNPEGSSELEKEWVSLLNISTKPIEIKNWTLVDKKQRMIKLSDLNILPGATHTVRMKDFKNSNFRLTNSGGSITLYNEKNEVIDREGYTAQEAREQGKALCF